MAADVVMPQLGMAQETGVIAAWRKSPGDRVSLGDVLMEVETDKAVMEVEATAEGVLLSVDCEAGVEVPVGSVVARIGKPGEAAEDAAAGKPAPPPEDKTGNARPSADGRGTDVPAPGPAPAAPARPVPNRDPDRVLASPKARMRAAERGLDLRELRRAGLPEPYHSADVDRFEGMRPSGSSALRASVPAGPLLEFVEWVSGGGGKAGMREVISAFAAGSWRKVQGGGKTTVGYRAVASGGVRELLSCTGRIAEVAPAPEGEEAHLALHDMSGTGLSEYEPAGAPSVPALNFAHDGDFCYVTLRFTEASLPLDKAAELLDAFAGRLADARLHLL